MLVGVVAAVLAFGVAPVGATHDPDLSDAEVSCQLNTAKSFSKLVSSVAGCRIKCETAQSKGTPGLDCVGPAYDPTTAACNTAAETAARNGELAKCTADCPECYTGGDCPADADARLVNTAGALTITAAIVYCAAPPTAEELKCENAVAKNGAKVIGSLSKCSQKCVSALHKGDATRVCSGTLDSTTKACHDVAVDKTGPAIDKGCATRPTCHDDILTALGRPTNGAGWAAALDKVLMDPNPLTGITAYDSTFCGE